MPTMWIVPVLALAFVEVYASKLVAESPAVTPDYEPFGGKNASILKSPADWNRNTFPLYIHCLLRNDFLRRA